MPDNWFVLMYIHLRCLVLNKINTKHKMYSIINKYIILIHYCFQSDEYENNKGSTTKEEGKWNNGDD